MAHSHQKQRGIQSGLIGVYSAVESCKTFKATFAAGADRPALRKNPTKCKHLYFYFDHQVFGFMSVRLQTWFPYDIQFQLNGREWLRRSLEQESIEFVRQGNKFLAMEDWDRAQALLNEQVHCLWPQTLDSIAQVVFPDRKTIIGPDDYYWTLWQSEWATDMVFDDIRVLDDMGQMLIKHAFMIGTPERVFRYLDRPLSRRGKIDLRCKDDVLSTIIKYSGESSSGYRIRHHAGRNSVKIYTEQNVTRIETTINDPGKFKIYRHKQHGPSDCPKELLPMRKGVADVAPRAVVSQEVNDRVMADLATMENDQPLSEILKTVCPGKKVKNRRVRSLDVTGKDRPILSVLSDPAFDVSGISNQLLREGLVASGEGSGKSQKQISGYVSRQIRLLRDHGILRKQPNQHRYHLTDQGRNITTAVNAIYNASIKELMKVAA